MLTGTAMYLLIGRAAGDIFHVVLDVEVPYHDSRVLVQTELHVQMSHCTNLQDKEEEV